MLRTGSDQLELRYCHWNRLGEKLLVAFVIAVVGLAIMLVMEKVSSRSSQPNSDRSPSEIESISPEQVI